MIHRSPTYAMSTVGPPDGPSEEIFYVIYKNRDGKPVMILLTDQHLPIGYQLL